MEGIKARRHKLGLDRNTPQPRYLEHLPESPPLNQTCTLAILNGADKPVLDVR